MVFRSLLKHATRWTDNASRRLVVVIAMILPGVSLADLPTLESPTQGTGGIRSQFQGYMYDGLVLGGLALCSVAFIWVGMACLASFNEARVRGEWSKFGVTGFVGVLLLLLVIWLTTEAAPILAQ
ncbi:MULTISPECIES: TIGR03745 family integrating conjugative element membrane protein [unclassified Modicisalibacter]|uniref:TIGR03745 family integrating conjugative element membrane protein n=1 Tax=unclassified Modicisalibacter TaxID=2679913 RepID=UPI001CCE17B8|nr:MULTISPECIES: TIGR03745 family integrating conjugative element membrane protein [unclassified Modicisalibacter]MBZ9559059.1 TIGR03745 family integrating conjugative element membrane protein [Modicisalibacter sp. R2A 31.J]MBZ9576830.1 TIGR03745 family integrating conjugative element membrane protein [Modicisalibacter sp. MOD 31.J]